jgi:8-oxo-dGTP pyrophosphatase MutT (NUDIX family)
MNEDFRRHIAACNNFVLPGDRLALWIGSAQVGWLEPQIAIELRASGAVSAVDDGLVLADPLSLPALAHDLAMRGFYRFRDEAFDVRARPGTPALTTIDRGALPAFGVMAEGVHLNGLVQRADGLHLWVARRAADKALDPGKLDHLVAGGVSAGMTPWETLIKESAEEAAIPAQLATQALKTSALQYTMLREEGLRRDFLHCYDVMLPEDFMPLAADGEVESFELWPIARAFETVRRTDDFKFNVSLVLIDLFERLGLS